MPLKKTYQIGREFIILNTFPLRFFFFFELEVKKEFDSLHLIIFVLFKTFIGQYRNPINMQLKFT